MLIHNCKKDTAFLKNPGDVFGDATNLTQIKGAIGRTFAEQGTGVTRELCLLTSFYLQIFLKRLYQDM